MTVDVLSNYRKLRECDPKKVETMVTFTTRKYSLAVKKKLENF